VTAHDDAHRLNALTDVLNEAIERAGDALADRFAGVTANVPLNDEGWTLHFKRHDQLWQLRLVNQLGEVCPGTSAPRKRRVEVAQALPALLVALREATSMRVADVEEAISTIRAFTAEVQKT